MINIKTLIIKINIIYKLNNIKLYMQYIYTYIYDYLYYNLNIFHYLHLFNYYLECLHDIQNIIINFIL